jgi:hypothetical protein
VNVEVRNWHVGIYRDVRTEGLDQVRSECGLNPDFGLTTDHEPTNRAVPASVLSAPDRASEAVLDQAQNL